jgi:hypothetical protein
MKITVRDFEISKNYRLAELQACYVCPKLCNERGYFLEAAGRKEQLKARKVPLKVRREPDDWFGAPAEFGRSRNIKS